MRHPAAVPTTTGEGEALWLDVYWQVFNGPFRYPWWGETYNIGLEPFTSATNRTGD